MKARVRAAAFGVLLAGAGCERGEPAARAARERAEEAILLRQIHGLRQLVEATEKGALLRDDQLVIAVDEGVIERLIGAGLPLSRDVAGRFLARLERVKVEFKAARSAVELQGRVSPLGMPGTYAELRLTGGLQRVRIDAATGRLKADLTLDDLEVVRAAAGGAESKALQSLIEELGRERAESFAELLPQLEIPITLEEAIHVSALDEGPVSVAGGRLPISASVARLIPLSGRLFIVIDAASGPWQREPGNVAARAR